MPFNYTKLVKIYLIRYNNGYGSYNCFKPLVNVIINSKINNYINYYKSDDNILYY